MNGFYSRIIIYEPINQHLIRIKLFKEAEIFLNYKPYNLQVYLVEFMSFKVLLNKWLLVKRAPTI